MATVQELVAKFKADTTDFNRKMQGVQKDVSDINAKVKILGSVLAASAVAIGTFAVKVGSAMDQSQKRIEAMLGSARDANTVIASLREAGYQTGVSVLELAQSYGKLATFVDNGTLSLKESLDISKGLTAASIALDASMEQLNQVMYGFSQAMGSGTVRAEEFNQVTDPLPGLINRIEQANKLAAGSLREMINEGKVTSEMFKDYLIPALQSFTSQAEEMADTLKVQSGILSNTFAALGEDIYDYLEQPLIDVTKALNDFLQTFVSVGRASQKELQRRMNENIQQQVALQQNYINTGDEIFKRELDKKIAEQNEIIARLESINPVGNKLAKTGGGSSKSSRGSSRKTGGARLRPSRSKSSNRSKNLANEIDPYAVSYLDLPTEDIKSEIGIIEQAMDGLSTSVISSFLEMSQSGKFSFQDMARSIINDLQAIMVKTLAMQAITGLIGSGIGAAFGSGGNTVSPSTNGNVYSEMMEIERLGALGFGGGRASGGSVLPNRSYLVGERGPEILTMGGNSGYIMSNQQSFGGGGGAVINIDARGAERGVEQRIRQVMGEVKNLRGQVPNIALTAVREQNKRSVGFLR